MFRELFLDILWRCAVGRWAGGGCHVSLCRHFFWAWNFPVNYAPCMNNISNLTNHWWITCWPNPMMLFLLMAMYEDPRLGCDSRGAAAVESCAIFRVLARWELKLNHVKKLILMLMKSLPTLSIIACWGFIISLQLLAIKSCQPFVAIVKLRRKPSLVRQC